VFSATPFLLRLHFLLIVSYPPIKRRENKKPAKTIPDFNQTPFRKEAFVVRVSYAVTFGTPLATPFGRHTADVSTDPLGEIVETVMTSISTILSNFKRAPFREEAFGFRVLYAVTFGTPSPTDLPKCTLHVLTDRLGENVENVMSRFQQTVSEFKWALSHDVVSFLHVLYAVTFVMPSATGLLEHTSHVSTDRLGENVENVTTLFCADHWTTISHLNCITCNELSLISVS